MEELYSKKKKRAQPTYRLLLDSTVDLLSEYPEFLKTTRGPVAISPVGLVLLIFEF
jgi:hypothetical protein